VRRAPLARPLISPSLQLWRAAGATLSPQLESRRKGGPAATPDAGARDSAGNLKAMKLAALLSLALLLTGCAQTVALEPADDAPNPVCADVSVRLPELVDAKEIRSTNAQATGAWGNPASIILRCGVPAPAPTAELPCVTVEGVDWLRDDTAAPNYVFTTYGRVPAVEVIVDGDAASGFAALVDLAPAVAMLPIEGVCIPPE
jgi:Protein of unknown function (DUF3515)